MNSAGKKPFADESLWYWFERGMHLAIRRSPDMTFTQTGDAEFTALAANFLHIATTVVFNRDSVDLGKCQIYGTNKGNLSFKKLKKAEEQVAAELSDFLKTKHHDEEAEDLKRRALDLLSGRVIKEKSRTKAAEALGKILKCEVDESEDLLRRIFRRAHPARIVLDRHCNEWSRTLVEREYLTDFSVLSDGKLMISMESEGKVYDGTSKFVEFHSIQNDTIFWDFFKLLNTSADYKFLLAVCGDGDEKNLRSELIKMLDKYVSGHGPSGVVGQTWVFVFSKSGKGSPVNFQMYEVETNPTERGKMSAQEVSEFLQ